MSLNIDPSLWRLRTAGTNVGTGNNQRHIDPIPYKLLEGFPKGSAEEETASVEEEIIIEADRLQDFIDISLSDFEIWPGTAWHYRPSRTYPGDSSMVTKTLSWEPYPPGLPGDPYGVDQDLSWVTPANPPEGTYSNFVKVSIHYEAGKGDEEKQDYEILEVSCSATGEFLSYSSKSSDVVEKEPGASSNPDGTPPDPDAVAAGAKKPLQDAAIPCSIIVPGLEWSVKFRRVPKAALPATVAMARTFLGKVNNMTMPVLFNAPPGTILFVGFSFSTKWSWRKRVNVNAPDDPMENSNYWAEVEVKLLEKQVPTKDANGVAFIAGHNFVFDPNSGLWTQIWRPPPNPPQKGNTPLYQGTNLNLIFGVLPTML